MAYNLEPLVQILEQFLHPSEADHHVCWILDPEKKPEIKSLYEKAVFVKEFFRNPSHRFENLEGRIRDASHQAEDILEAHLADRILSGQSFTVSPPSLRQVIQQFEEIKKMMVDVGNPVSPSADAGSTRRIQDPNPKNNLVGLSKDLLQLRDRLTRQSPKLEIIAITGMGGIGKTTLARKVYDDPCITSHFDTRAWIAVSQEYDVQAIVLGLLGCVIGEQQLADEILEEGEDHLDLHLYQKLCGRRYLIVLDDVWSISAWDDTKMFFPEFHQGSRILITTRELNVANAVAGSLASHHQMNFLGNVESWDLLREKVFAGELCPSELENVGKKIANNCKGLPLAIHVIGGLLSQDNKTQESWEKVADDIVSSIVANKDELFSNILSLSYNYLPNHLKPCFLYMSAFPEDYEIRASRIIRLWVADGFVKPIAGKTLEEAAHEYLNALVERNLISVGSKKANYAGAEIYGLHDLLRDLCVRKAREDKFLYCIKNSQVREDSPSFRRVSACKKSDLYASVEPMQLARSFLYVGAASLTIRSPSFLGLRMLKEVDVLQVEFQEFPEEILQLANLRYLAFSCHKLVHCSISRLLNLQTLIFRATPLLSDWPVDTAHEAFDIPQLRCIKFKGVALFYYEWWRKHFVVQKKLQTISGLAISELTDHKILDRIPNLKSLGVYCNKMVSQVIDLTRLDKLESFKCNPVLRWPLGPQTLSRVIFPSSLKKLSLRGCMIPVGYINRIATELPNLEVLKLRNSTLESSNWELAETEDDEFRQLKFLLMEKLNLVNWVADETHFPRLERLIIRECSQLQQIPWGIGDIPTLELIELSHCSPSAAASLRKIHEEQIDVGNDALQVFY